MIDQRQAAPTSPGGVVVRRVHHLRLRSGVRAGRHRRDQLRGCRGDPRRRLQRHRAGVPGRRPGRSRPDLPTRIAGLRRFWHSMTAEPLEPADLETGLCSSVSVPPQVLGALVSRQIDSDDVLSRTPGAVLVTHGRKDQIVLTVNGRPHLQVCPTAQRFLVRRSRARTVPGGPGPLQPGAGRARPSSRGIASRSTHCLEHFGCCAAATGAGILSRSDRSSSFEVVCKWRLDGGRDGGGILGYAGQCCRASMSQPSEADVPEARRGSFAAVVARPT